MEDGRCGNPHFSIFHIPFSISPFPLLPSRVPSGSQPAIGFWMAVALVMGNMIGSGIFLLPSSLASFGGMSLVGWLISAGGSVCLALVFARLARLGPSPGGPYAYTRRAFGDFAGFLLRGQRSVSSPYRWGEKISHGSRAR